MENIISSISNMSTAEYELNNLLQIDIAEKGKQAYHPVRLVVNGVPTQKALAFNKRMLREGKTTQYLDSSKIFNVDTNRVVNAPIDRRYNDGRYKPSFKNNVNVVGRTFAIKKDTQSFRYTFDDIFAPNYDESNKNTIFSNDLLRQIIIDNGFSGNYRILIKKGGNIIVDKSTDIGDPNSWWKQNKETFRVDSEFMKWNYELEPGDVVNIIFTKEKKLNKKYFAQTYNAGILGFCLIGEVKNWIEMKMASVKGKESLKKYKARINKFIGKDGYLEKFKNGIPETKIPAFCEDLQIGVSIEQPFSDEKLFEYKSQSKPIKKFRYLNTRLNHVDCLKGRGFNPFKNDKNIWKIGDCVEIEDRKVLYDILQECWDNGENPAFGKDKYGINKIQTLTTHYRIKNDYNTCVQEWEQEQGFKRGGVEFDALEHPELMKFINKGTHFNGTIDFKDTSRMRGKNKVLPSDLKHIDMSKAYTQYKNCTWYDGFMIKISDFRPTNKYYDNGLYYITNLDLSGCNEKFVKLNDNLGWYYSDNVYPLSDLKALESYGGKFDILYGAYGIKGEFTFSEEMLTGVDKFIFEDEEIKVPYYSKWCGMNCMINENKNFWMKGDKEYFENLNTDTDIYYADDMARISYPNKYQYNKKHITAQITSYQRLFMLEQLMMMDLDSVIRLCVDGIYYHDHDYENKATIEAKQHKIFSVKSKVTFENFASEFYLSNVVEKGTTDFECTAQPREHYMTQIFDGAGGDGKTYGNLIIDTGFINIGYCPHSWKLCSAMAKLFKEKRGSRLRLTNHNRLLKDNGDKEYADHPVLVIDECSMLTEYQKKKLIQLIVEEGNGKIIFCGDLECQIIPFNEKPMNKTGIENEAEKSKKNWRFTCPIQLHTCNLIRKCIIYGQRIEKKDLPYKFVDVDFVKKNYNHKKDMILVSRGADKNERDDNYNNYWCKVFEGVEKYKVIKNFRDYHNGDIIFEEIKGLEYKLRHGFTTHSVQGETYEGKIFIDMRKMYSNRMFYTAVSRAKRADQIYLIEV